MGDIVFYDGPSKVCVKTGEGTLTHSKLTTQSKFLKNHSLEPFYLTNNLCNRKSTKFLLICAIIDNFSLKIKKKKIRLTNF